MAQCQDAPSLNDDARPICHGEIGLIHGEMAATDNSDRALDRLVASPGHIRLNHGIRPIG